MKATAYLDESIHELLIKLETSVTAYKTAWQSNGEDNVVEGNTSLSAEVTTALNQSIVHYEEVISIAGLYLDQIRLARSNEANSLAARLRAGDRSVHAAFLRCVEAQLFHKHTVIGADPNIGDVLYMTAIVNGEERDFRLTASQLGNGSGAPMQRYMQRYADNRYFSDLFPDLASSSENPSSFDKLCTLSHVLYCTYSFKFTNFIISLLFLSHLVVFSLYFHFRRLFYDRRVTLRRCYGH